MPSLKSQNLIVLSKVVSVPPFFCIEHQDFRHLLADFQALEQQLEQIWQKITLTSGSFLDQHAATLEQILEQVQWHHEADNWLSQSLTRVFGQPDGHPLFAVRSASIFEDSSQQSYAGLYESCLNVSGLTALKAAILKVWKSGYAYPALVERLNSQQPSAPLQMDVIIQQMVMGKLSGVAFSRDPVTAEAVLTIEYVGGLGDRLVAGEASGQMARYADGQWLTADPPECLADVVALMQKVQSALGGELDIEWSWDGEAVWLLQARPITSCQPQLSESAEPIGRFIYLYAASDAELATFVPLPAYAAYFRKKRKAIYDFAQRHRLGVGTALLLQFNQAGLQSLEFQAKLVQCFQATQVVLDFSDRIRQLIIERDRLIAELQRLTTQSTTLYAVVVRDFIAGDFGLITRVLEDDTSDRSGSVFCEYSFDGLLAINRGTAQVQQLDLDRGSSSLTITSQDLALLRDSTLAAQTELGLIQIEWVFANQRLYPIDFSPVVPESQLSSIGDVQIISEGFAQGPIVNVEAHEDLVALSIAPTMSLTHVPSISDVETILRTMLEQIRACNIPPIVVVSKPYAILAILIPYVAGFVFENAAILCHLAILLREKRIPAICSSALYRRSQQQQQIIIDTQATLETCVSFT